jgi:sugar O-acyltransferase (sialic acid O-acetyltransferase NeuD family)
VTIRRRVFERLAQPSDRYAVMIHPRAYVSFNADVEPGCIVYPHVAIGPGAVLSRNSVVYFNSVIHHDSVVGSHSMLCAGVNVAGGVMLGSCVYAGISSTVRDGIRVGDDTLIGMGAVVTRDVAAGQTVCGVPAREREPVVESVLS